MKLRKNKPENNTQVNSNEAEGAVSYERIAMYLIWIGVLIIVFFSLAYGLNEKGFIPIHFGEYGQFISGLTGSIWALAGVMLFYEALKYQRSEMKMQRHELELQRFVQIQQNDLFKQQNLLLEVQTFEGTLFNLINLLNQIVENVEVEIRTLNKSGQAEISKTKGRESFYDYYNSYKRIFNYTFENIHHDNFSEDSLRHVIEYSFRSFYEENQAALGHYIRTLSHLLLFLDKPFIKNKHFYLELIISQLSNYEFALLYFIGLSGKYQNLKPIIEKYGLLAEVPNDELIELSKGLYSERAFSRQKGDTNKQINT